MSAYYVLGISEVGDSTHILWKRTLRPREVEKLGQSSTASEGTGLGFQLGGMAMEPLATVPCCVSRDSEVASWTPSVCDGKSLNISRQESDNVYHIYPQWDNILILSI